MPLCLGMADELREAGNMIARDIFGLPLLLVRDREGEIRIRLNVCRHRSARLVLDENEVSSSAWAGDAGAARSVSKYGPGRPPSLCHTALIWAQRLKRVFKIDVETCATCGRTMKVSATVEAPAVIKRILAHLESGQGAGQQPERPPHGPRPHSYCPVC